MPVVSDSVAIITARGGSKRIPRKNIRDFLGQPIIAYSIAAALTSGCFAEVMVSTDDPEIAQLAEKLGAKVPFLRSAAGSGDFASTADVLLEVLDAYRSRNRDFAYACAIYPTAPFVTAQLLRRGHDLLVRTGAEAVIPVVRFGYPVQRALKIAGDRLTMIWPEHVSARSQDLEPAYHDSGQFYFIETKRFLQTGTLFGSHTVPIELPESEVQDIDTEEDWLVAEMKYRALQQSGGRNGRV
jgi:pseudaminic acid cytidylyltransferase